MLQDTASLERAEISMGRPVLVHHVVVRRGEKGLEVLHTHLEEKGETLPVFSAGWAAREYTFAEAPRDGWYVKACAPDEMLSLLDGTCADVEWIVFDPKAGYRRRNGALNMMPRESFVDYLLGSCVTPSPLESSVELESEVHTI